MKKSHFPTPPPHNRSLTAPLQSDTGLLGAGDLAALAATRVTILLPAFALVVTGTSVRHNEPSRYPRSAARVTWPSSAPRFSADTLAAVGALIYPLLSFPTGACDTRGERGIPTCDD